MTVCFHYLPLRTQPCSKELKNLVQSAASYRAEVEHLRLTVERARKPARARQEKKNSPRNSDIRGINVISRRSEVTRHPENVLARDGVFTRA